MTHAITAAELLGVLARLTVREDEERWFLERYAVAKLLGCLAVGPCDPSLNVLLKF